MSPSLSRAPGRDVRFYFFITFFEIIRNYEALE